MKPLAWFSAFACAPLCAAPVWQAGDVTYEARLGSLHSHTSLTDGCGTPAEAFEHARDVAGMDWWGVSDHIFSGDNPRRTLTTDAWQGLRDAAEEFNEPGRFVTFSCYEWTVGAEHIVVLGVDTLVASPEFETLADVTNKAGGLLNYSHIWLNASPYMFADRHPEYMPEFDEALALVDVFAVPGYRPAFEEIIGAGYHAGAFAGQDNHDRDWGLTGNAFGWAAAWTTRLDREGLLEAFRAGRTYATRKRDLALRFSAGDLLMGETTDSRPQTARVVVDGAPDAVLVEVMRDGVQIETRMLTSRDGTYDFPVNLRTNDPGRHAFHVRLWGDAEPMPLAVSSPLWIGTGEANGLVFH